VRRSKITALGAVGEVEDKGGGEGLVIISILVLVYWLWRKLVLFCVLWSVIFVLWRQYKCKNKQTMKLAMNSATTN
jgi:hypothetical protein